MRLILLIPLLQVALGESLQKVFGYLGENITLPSGADPSWNLSKVQWSIFSNNTLIATYHNEKANIDRIDQYQGRLSLNTSSGDLAIHNLNAKDAMVYNVDVINTEKKSTKNKIELTVKQHLQKPTIETHTWVPRESPKSGCLVKVQCSSLDEGVQFSWYIEPLSVTTLNTSLPDGKSALLLAFLNNTEHTVKVTCNTSRNIDTASSVVTSKCEDEKTTNQRWSETRNRYCAVIVIGAFMGNVLLISIIHVFGEQKKTLHEKSQLDIKASRNPSDQTIKIDD
uniref:Ig-like domain-containing protein n=1 Tax=Anabas testudineus TaxID=64144 RepID=A0AAQ6ISC8_ANATE